jgi:hypothetical protein
LEREDNVCVNGEHYLGVFQLHCGPTNGSKRTGPTNIKGFKLKDVKDRRIILDGVKDHLIPHLSGKTPARDMWEALKSLFQSKNENRKMVLREKLRDMKMTGLDTVMTYLTWI